MLTFDFSYIYIYVHEYIYNEFSKALHILVYQGVELEEIFIFQKQKDVLLLYFRLKVYLFWQHSLIQTS